jgi:hypothetical protein
VVSQGPAAAFVPGVGVVGTTGGDIDRHFDLAIVDRGAPRRIGVRVQLTPVLAGGPDGRLYVNDVGADTFTAYTIRGRTATLVAGPTTGACERGTVTFDATSARCGAATLTLGPTDPTTQWTLQTVDHTTPTDVQLASDRAFEPLEVRYDLADGSQLWLIPFSWTGRQHDTHYRTAVVTVSGTRAHAAQIDARVAGVDLVHHVIYGWGDINPLFPFDYTSLATR